MAIRKIKTGWQIDFYDELGKRVRKCFKTRAEAGMYQRWYEEQKFKNSQWMPKKKNNNKTLDEYINIYEQQHSMNLARPKNTIGTLKRLCKKIGNPELNNLTKELINIYRRTRIDEGIKKSTINREIAYLNSMINELIKLDILKEENPIKGIKELKIQEKEVNYLNQKEIKELFELIKSVNDTDIMIASKICLATGARWSEACNIKAEDIKNGQVTIKNTKNRRVRNIPINDELANEIKAHGKIKNKDQKFRKLIIKSGFKLPKGQKTHVLRHTFASHFIMEGGNILALQKILGHQKIEMTMKYAHLSDEYMKEVIQLSPIKFLGYGQK